MRAIVFLKLCPEGSFGIQPGLEDRDAICRPGKVDAFLRPVRSPGCWYSAQMPQSLARVPVQLVFSTKNREPILTPELDERLYSYIAGILKSEGHTPIAVGGHVDHVHVFFALSRTQTISKIVEIVKVGSGRWLQSEGLDDFHWQVGYGIFGVSESDVANTAKYVLNQKEHHATVSFPDELRKLLKENGISYDERYLWD